MENEQNNTTLNSVDKYNAIRDNLKNGDIFLFHGTGWLAKLIQFFDKSYYNHIGICFEQNGRFFILDENGNGSKPDFLSFRVSQYADFCVVRPLRPVEEITNAVNEIMDKATADIKYNFFRLLEIAIFKETGKTVNGLDMKNRDICSQFVQQYTDLLQIKCFNVIDNPLITPEDFIRKASMLEVDILYNDNDIRPVVSAEPIKIGNPSNNIKNLNQNLPQ